MFSDISVLLQAILILLPLVGFVSNHKAINRLKSYRKNWKIILFLLFVCYLLARIILVALFYSMHRYLVESENLSIQQSSGGLFVVDFLFWVTAWKIKFVGDEESEQYKIVGLMILESIMIFFGAIFILGVVRFADMMWDLVAIF